MKTLTESTPRPTLGILHPGEMGLSIAASAQNSGYSVYWIAAGRSPQTAERAKRIGLIDAGSLAALCEACSVIASVCPPHAAEDVARSVANLGFSGLYVDMNAIAPQRAIRIAKVVTAQGAMFVDGGIIGGPAWNAHSTWLYLSGPEAQAAADCFAAGPLETAVIGSEVGKASALKMCYAALTKGTTALLCGVLAAAEALEVRADLEGQWAREDSAQPDKNIQRARQVTAKAWRFAGEMDEIAATFDDAGLPDGFHRAAGELYQRMAGFKDAASLPPLEAVLAALLQNVEDGKPA
ncbi:MAG: NAD(P)-binding domain-containing protein [Anaerolineae bacterium]